jgi:hypothetical protein
MYVPLQVEPRFWFNRRVEVDSRLSPSPSIQALKVVRDTNKKHLRFISQYEKKLLERMDRDDANRVYKHLGLKLPALGQEPWPEPNRDSDESYRIGDLKPITVAGLRSHHHPVSDVKAKALATWKAMRDDYRKNQQAQAAVVDSWAPQGDSWAPQNDSSFAETDGWTTQETYWGEEPDNTFTSDFTAASYFNCENHYTDYSGECALQGENWWASGYGTEKPCDEFPELPGTDRWLTQLPTPPPSDTCSLPSSPVLSTSHFVSKNGVTDPVPSGDSSASNSPILSAREELYQVLNDRKIMQALLDGIEKRIKKFYTNKSDKEKSKVAETQENNTAHREGCMSRAKERGDPRRTLRFGHSSVLSPDEVKNHILESTCKSHFETHFQMTHQYEDAAGKVYKEPLVTQGVPTDNTFAWTRTHPKRKPRF